MKNFQFTDRFIDRHIGPNEDEIKEMLMTIGVSSLDELIDKTIPAKIRLKEELNTGEAVSEYEFLNHLKEIAKKNKVFKSYIGMGYNSTITPPVIQRNILENPGWYTQYTPYQAEISQGRLEALLNFQTMVADLTGLPIVNSSLLDEATAAAEAMLMLFAARKRDKKGANVFFVSEDCFPQTIDVLRTRAVPLGIELLIGNHEEVEITDNIFGVLVQYPSKYGKVVDYTKYFETLLEKGIAKVVAADIMSLVMLKAPGNFGADVVIGNTQRFGVPMGNGGPHAAYFATKEDYKRLIPGRVIGVSIDSNGNPALRMALQTREQHIKREKATSNICTAQVLLAIMASMYAVYHGSKGIKAIAERIHNLTCLLDKEIQKLGVKQLNKNYFDTLVVEVKSELKNKIEKTALNKEINFNYISDTEISISLGETVTLEDVIEIISILSSVLGADATELDFNIECKIPEEIKRKEEFFTHPVFNSYHTETELMRYIKKLESRDLSLTTSMIPLGSCTMKLNAAAELFGISWPEFANIHPFAPSDQTVGYKELFEGLTDQLSSITGFPGISLQPNSGAAGEYAGLMVIRAYHESRGEGNRNVVLIPASAHGTNPASAVMAGGKVVVIKCDENGNIDIDDLKVKAEEHKEVLSSLMITYPSTHGVFEETVMEVCEIVHNNGAQVYMDGANMNAQVGFTSPAKIGADVCHLNLHKTFSIPHGGGGPGVGPIGVADHLIPFLPGHSLVELNGGNTSGAVSAAPYGSAGVMLITYAYIKMMGGRGLIEATRAAILNANYILARLRKEYEVLYKGKNGFVAHEMIFDTRVFKQASGIEVEDIAKRLMDYGYHAPTVSFPVPGTLMVEPTESESKAELDKFCDTLIQIKKEINEVIEGTLDKTDNPLKNAPHTSLEVTSDEWTHSYSRQKAAYPAEWIKVHKFWPYVGRVNNTYGDRNLMCTCLPISDYIEE
ncbi:MAG: aminomethyl-transferring glycine dehydrogenase [Melioribacteraceae bacterium]|nr:aminomethyl-transferring glycine dehydrogenase [Melioribacteraceae bacterium]